MAVAKSSSFFLTERLQLSASGTIYQGTLDLGAYVDAGDSQGLAIESVDFIWQGSDANGNAVPFGQSLAGNSQGEVQLLSNDTNTAFVFANDHRLIASGQLYYDNANEQLSTESDQYPDNFGKGDMAYYVVNDQLFLVAENTGTLTTNHTLMVTVRIRARIVKIQQKDWMAIALQSTAQDN